MFVCVAAVDVCTHAHARNGVSITRARASRTHPSLRGSQSQTEGRARILKIKDRLRDSAPWLFSCPGRAHRSEIPHVQTHPCSVRPLGLNADDGTPEGNKCDGEAEDASVPRRSAIAAARA